MSGHTSVGSEWHGWEHRGRSRVSQITNCCKLRAWLRRWWVIWGRVRDAHTEWQAGTCTGRRESVSCKVAPDSYLDKKRCPSQTSGNVVNLSGYRLPAPALSLLQKGLSFIPSPQFDGPHCDVSRDLTSDLETLKERYIDRYTGELTKKAYR